MTLNLSFPTMCLWGFEGHSYFTTGISKHDSRPYSNTVGDHPGEDHPLSFIDGIDGGLSGAIVNNKALDNGYLQWLA
jgi:hypothetical protein